MFDDGPQGLQCELPPIPMCYRPPIAPSMFLQVGTNTFPSSTFPACIYDKISFPIPEDPNNPLFDGGCPPIILPLSRGEFSFFEVERDPDYATGGGVSPWRWRIKAGGRSGRAGTCDAAHEANWSNANIHLERMIVEMHENGTFERPSYDCPGPSSQFSSSELYFGSSAEVIFPMVHFYFFLNVPREDCANPYVISHHPHQDFQ